jgi:hypothetical protein
MRPRPHAGVGNDRDRASRVVGLREPRHAERALQGARRVVGEQIQLVRVEHEGTARLGARSSGVPAIPVSDSAIGLHSKRMPPRRMFPPS